MEDKRIGSAKIEYSQGQKSTFPRYGDLEIHRVYEIKLLGLTIDVGLSSTSSRVFKKYMEYKMKLISKTLVNFL